MSLDEIEVLQRLEEAASGGLWFAEHHAHETKTHPYNSALIIVVEGKNVHKLHHSVENTAFVAAMRMSAKEILRLAKIGLQRE